MDTILTELQKMVLTGKLLNLMILGHYIGYWGDHQIIYLLEIFGVY